MGAQSTKSGVTFGHLTLEEVAELRKVFGQICGSSPAQGSDKNSCSYSNFQAHCEKYLDDWLSKKLTDKLASKSKASGLVITEQNFLQFSSVIFKESLDEKFDLIWSVVTEGKLDGSDKSFVAEDIYMYVRSVIESYLKSIQDLQLAKSWANALPVSNDAIGDMALATLQDLFYKNVNQKSLIDNKAQYPGPKNPDGSLKKFSLEDVVKAISHSGLFLKMHDSVYSECFSFNRSTDIAKGVLPCCVRTQTAFTSTDFTLLDLTKVLFLNSHLPVDSKKKWRHLFSTSQHGESFSKLLGSIQEKGSTVIIIRDEKGRLFGAFAPQSWSLNPKFYGNEESFLFHLSPRLITYFPTGYNNNFQYLNMQQKTLPNGMGFGGTFEYFGLWIDSEFGKGKCSPSCTTYSDCPQLSLNPEFTIDHLEVWGVGEEPQKPEGERDTSILDKDPEAKMMLEMMGKCAVSDGCREVPKDND